jgi:polyisoprenoid-binding protein YceI
MGEFSYIAKGKLTLRGITKDVDLMFNYFGKKEQVQYDADGNEVKFNVSGFEGEFKITCKDYGIDMGGTADVEFTIEAMQPVK